MPRKKLVCVYGLASSKDKKIRYIGQTTDKVMRLHKHRIAATGNCKADKHPVHYWMEGVYNKGYDVILITLTEDAEEHVVETKMIAKYPDLLNVQPGQAFPENKHIIDSDKIAYIRQQKFSTKLTESDVLEVKKLLLTGMTQAKIGKKFGVSRCCIGDIKSGRRWGYLGMPS